MPWAEATTNRRAGLLTLLQHGRLVPQRIVQLETVSSMWSYGCCEQRR